MKSLESKNVMYIIIIGINNILKKVDEVSLNIFLVFILIIS